MTTLAPLTDSIRRDLLAWLRERAVGRENAITMSALADSFFGPERLIREWCGSEEFIEAGVCTASSQPCGVWVAATPDEYDAAIGHQESRVEALQKRVDLMKLARLRLYGPLFSTKETEVG